jgi:hypothetical protein
MIGLDFSATSERLFAGVAGKHLGATAAATAMLVLLFEIFAPSGRWVHQAGQQTQYKMDHERVVLRWRDREDPRGFTTPEEAGTPPDAFGLAWISGSSISIRPDRPEYYFKGLRAYELTDVFAAQTKSINGQPFEVHEYLIQGSRTGDMRRAALHAAEDPLVDAIVMSLNPVWLYNELAVLTESNQRASIAGMKGAQVEDLALAIGYARPSALITEALASRLRFIRLRYPIAQRALSSANGVKLIFPFLKSPEQGKIAYPAMLDRYESVEFRAPPEMRSIAGYRATLLKQHLDEYAVSARFFALLLESLAHSGKPVLLYAAPLPAAIENDPEVLQFMERWSAFTQEMVRSHGGQNIRLRTDTYRKVDGVIVHKDIVHLYYGQGVVDTVLSLLSSELGLQLEQAPAESFYGVTTP